MWLKLISTCGEKNIWKSGNLSLSLFPLLYNCPALMYIVLKYLHVESNCSFLKVQDCQLKQRSLSVCLAPVTSVVCLFLHTHPPLSDYVGLNIKKKKKSWVQELIDEDSCIRKQIHTMLADFYLVKAHTLITVGQTKKFTLIFFLFFFCTVFVHRHTSTSIRSSTSQRLSWFGTL